MQEEAKVIEIARMGHPVLMHPAESVGDILSSDVQSVIDDLIQAHKQEGGVGLAAPQIFIPLRILVMEVTPSCALLRDIEQVPRTVLINPEIEILDETPITTWEGCISVPGMVGEVSRPRKVAYKAFDRDGNPVSGVLEGYSAKILQHELDHLDGRLYVSRLTDVRRFGFANEVREFLID